MENTTSAGKGGQGAGRPRSTRAQQAILATALRLVRQEGFAALTIEKIAREAGVGKPTIYRWWPSKGAIVFDALQLYAQEALPLPPEGLLEERLGTWLRALFAVLNEDTGDIVRALMAEAQLDPDFAVFFREEFILIRRQPLLLLLREGIERGELEPGADCELLADLIYGAMWYRLLARHASLDEQYAHDIVDMLFRDAKPRSS